MSLSTHVLDAVAGRPAAGVAVALDSRTGDGREAGWSPAGRGRTDADGRLRDWLPAGVPGPGTHRLTFATGDYFAARGVTCFYPEVVVVFAVTDPGAHHHVPLLLSPYAYSTYRGS